MKFVIAISLTLLTAIPANAQAPSSSADERAVEDALVRAGVGSHEAIRAQMAWDRCTERAPWIVSLLRSNPRAPSLKQQSPPALKKRADT